VFVLFALLLLLAQQKDVEMEKKFVIVPYKQESAQFIQPIQQNEKVIFVKPVDKIVIFQN